MLSVIEKEGSKSVEAESQIIKNLFKVVGFVGSKALVHEFI